MALRLGLVMGRSAELGTLEPGELADLVVLDADPLADIRNTQAIHRVMKGGAIFDPAEILRSLAAPDRPRVDPEP